MNFIKLMGKTRWNVNLFINYSFTEMLITEMQTKKVGMELTMLESIICWIWGSSIMQKISQAGIRNKKNNYLRKSIIHNIMRNHFMYNLFQELKNKKKLFIFYA